MFELQDIRSTQSNHRWSSWLACSIFVLSSCQSAKTVSAPPPEPPRVALPALPETRAVDSIRESALKDFYRGKDLALAGQFDCAALSFDSALITLESRPVPDNEQLELIEFADELFASINSYENLAVQDETEIEPPRIGLEKLAEVEPETTSRAELDRSAHTLAGEDLTSFDLPVEINERVLAFIAQYQGPLRDFYSSALARSGKYVTLFQTIFEEEGIPQDLAYMALVESAFKPNAHSWARAHGLWQFIPTTGRLYGLRNSPWIDERSDPEKSTRAAAHYLKYLHLLFDDWNLAMAAYNAGEGKVLRAIRRSGKTDFWSLAETRYLMRETKNYVPAILAALIIGKEPERFGFTVGLEPPMSYDRVVLEEPADMKIVADICGVPLDTIHDLNPELRTRWTPPKSRSYSLRVPTGTASLVSARLAEIPAADRLGLKMHTVKMKEGLGSIAKKYGITQASLCAANELSLRASVPAGTTLVIPPVELRLPGRERNGSRNPASRAIRVRRGETLSMIAKRAGTSVSALAAMNGISPSARLQSGQRLRVPAPESPGPSTASTPGKNQDAPPRRRSQAIRYSVRRGDTLDSIASAHGATVDQLRKWNRLGQSKKLLPGQTLTLFASGR